MIHENVELYEQDVEVKGSATIEIFGADGELIHKHKQDNFVSPSILKGTAIENNYLGKTKLGNDVSGMYFLNNIEQSYGIILTDNDKEPEPNDDFFIEGKLLAMSRRGMTNTSAAARGTYNSVESVHTSTYRRYVYDFGTNQANGTFQSIYTGVFDESGTTVLNYPTMYLYNFISHYSYGSTQLSNFCYMNGVVYATSGGSLFKVNMLNPDFWELPLGHQKTNFHAGQYKGEFVEVVNMPNNLAFYNLCTHGNYFYFVLSDGFFYKAPISNILDMTKFGDIRTVIGHASYSGYGMKYHPIDKLIYYYVYDYNVGTTNSVVISINPANNVIAKTSNKFWNTTYPNSFDMDFDANGNILYSGGIKSPSGSFITPTFLSMYNTANQGTRYLGKISDNYSLVLSHSGSYGGYFIGVVANTSYYSRALLDSPVTKTSQNTMKITYEFNYPKRTF